MHHDVKIGGARIRNHDLWIRKRVCYPLHHSAPQIPDASQYFNLRCTLTMPSYNVRMYACVSVCVSRLQSHVQCKIFHYCCTICWGSGLRPNTRCLRLDTRYSLPNTRMFRTLPNSNGRPQLCLSRVTDLFIQCGKSHATEIKFSWPLVFTLVRRTIIRNVIRPINYSTVPNIDLSANFQGQHQGTTALWSFPINNFMLTTSYGRELCENFRYRDLRAPFDWSNSTYINSCFPEMAA